MIENETINEILSEAIGEDLETILDNEISVTKPVVEENSKSLLVDETTSRFSSAVWYEQIQKTEVTIVGQGGIGSWASILLSRMKPQKMIIYDNDVVEPGNMSGQLFTIKDMEELKVNAVNKNLQEFSCYYNVLAIPTKFDHTSTPTPIMMCGLDNMQARNQVFHSWYSLVKSLDESSKKNCLLIDARLAAEEFQIFCLRGDDEYCISKYKDEWLFSDSQAEETLCSYKQTSFCANLVAGFMVNALVNFIANMCNPIIERPVPFFTSYNAELMYFKTED